MTRKTTETMTLHETRVNRWVLATGAGFAMLAVITGAFAAHGLKPILDDYGLSLFETAARYQMYHAIALLIVGVISTISSFPRYWLNIAACAFISGIILFSGSLYLLAFSGIKWLGAVTPLGGGAFILGWVALLVATLKRTILPTQ